jgi:hypothetical protein
MAPRVADLVVRVQRLRALTADLGDEIDDRIHTCDRHEGAVVARVAGLPAGLAPTLPAPPACALAARETIGGRRFRGRGGVLLPQRELAFEIRDPLRLLRELFAKPFVLLSQSFDLVRLAITGGARWLVASRSLFAPRLHQPERSESV